MVETSGPVREAGLDADVAPGSYISRVLRRRRFDIVGVVQPQPLNALYRMLLVPTRVGRRRFKERSRQRRCSSFR